MFNRKSYILLVVFLIALLAFNTNRCLNFDALENRCNQCPQNTRLFKVNCLFNVNNCQSYRKGIDCNKCQHGFKLVVGNYHTFQLKSFGGAEREDIPQNQIIEADSQEINQNLSNQGIKNHLNQTQNISQIVQIPTKPKSQQQQQKEQDQIKQTSDFNYEYQKKQSRQKDIGFETSNECLKLSNTKILGQNAKVVGCIARTSGLRKNYRIFYKATNQQIYQGEVIYDVVKRRAY